MALSNIVVDVLSLLVVFDHLSIDSSRVCSFSSQLVDGVVQFLHRE